VLRVQLDRALLLRQELVERAIEHPDDLRALVVHDRARLAVPEDGDREPAGVVRLRAEVQVLDVLGTDLRVGVRAREGVG
jgi:hypothetical protein